MPDTCQQPASPTAAVEQPSRQWSGQCCTQTGLCILHIHIHDGEQKEGDLVDFKLSIKDFCSYHSKYVER